MIPGKLDIQLYRAATHNITIDVNNSVGAPFEIVGINQLRIYRNYNEAAILTVPLTWNGTALVGTLDTDDSDIEAGSYPYHLWNVDGLAEKPVLRGMVQVADVFVGNFVNVVSSVVVDSVTYEVTVVAGFVTYDGFEFVEKFGSNAEALIAAWDTKKRIQLQSRTKYELADAQLTDSAASDIVIEGNFGEVETNSNDPTISLQPAYESEQVVLAIDLSGTRPVLTITDSSVFTYGDIFLIISDEDDPLVNNRRMAEVGTVYDIVNATNIEVNVLRKTYDVLQNVKIRKYSNKNIQIRNLYLSKDSSDLSNFPGTQVNRIKNIEIVGAKNPIVEYCIFKNLAGRGVNIINCVGAVTSNIIIEGGENQGAPGNFSALNNVYGNGIMNSGSSYCIAKNIVFSNCRHGIFYGAVRPEDETEFDAGGMGYGNIVLDCIGYNNTGTSYDTHRGASFTSFKNCYSYDSERGFMLRGVGHILDGCESRGDFSGVEVLVEGGAYTTTDIKIKNMIIENAVRPMILATVGNGDVYFSNSHIINDRVITSAIQYGMILVLESYNLKINNLTIDINHAWGFNGAIFEIQNTLAAFNITINKLTINIAEGIVLDNWSVFVTNADLNFTINNLEINCPDAGNYPQYLISSGALNVLTGKIYNSKFDGIAVKLHNQTLDNQTFVDNHGRGHIVIGDNILTKS